MQRGFPIGACSIWGLLVVGCDPVRTTLQQVHVQVCRSDSGAPVAGAEVSLKYDLDRGQLMSKEQTSRDAWKQDPWYSGMTDKEGRANIGVEYTVIDRTIGSKPPADRDWVTGQPYLVRLRKDQVCEELNLSIRPGASGRGKVLGVDIVRIEKPYYVKGW